MTRGFETLETDPKYRVLGVPILKTWGLKNSDPRRSDVPVMEIVAEFRRMATGPNGLNHHRLWAPPKYEYEKRRTQAAKETIAKALMAQMPVLSDKAA